MSEIVGSVVSDIVAEDVPTLQDLLSSLSTEGQSLLECVENLLARVERGELCTESGISLLDVKYYSLLSYVIDLVVLARMKINGSSIAECQAKYRLVENRTVLEKLSPLEHKIKYQIDKLLQQSEKNASNDPLGLKPNIDDLENKLEDSASENEDAEKELKKYVPPRIAASHYDFDDGKEDTKLRHAKERALRKSSIIMDLAQDTSDAPLELSEYSSGRRRVQKERDERRKYEEANLTRINLTKKQKNMEKQMMRRSELSTITKFGDIGVLEGGAAPHEKQKRKSKGKHKAGKKWKRFKK